MIRKFASLESAQVLDLKGSQARSKTASLDKLSEFEDYRTEDGYLYARIRAISSRVNKNHDGWPSVELAGGKDVFEHHANKTAGFTVQANRDESYGFSTFLGKPIFVDHNNSNPDRARGVIVDAKLHVEDHKTAAHDPYYSSDDVDPEHTPPTWVELLLEVDAKSFPRLAKAIIDGSKDSKKGIDGFSMGCDVEKSVCNICKNAATTPEDFCNHVKLKGAHFDAIDKHGRKTSKRSYENCYGIKFFEISAVFDPADETALIREVKASVEKEADIWSDCVVCQGTGQHYGKPCYFCGGSGRSPGTPQGRPLAPPPSPSVGPTVNPPSTVLTSWNDRLGTKEHLKGVDSDKRQRQYEHIKEQLLESGKSEEEAKEEAARTVNKQRAEHGETKNSNYADGTPHPNMPGVVWSGQNNGWVRYVDPQVSPKHAPSTPGDLSQLTQQNVPRTVVPQRGGVLPPRQADNPLPQADMMTVPEYVDTMREEEVCPVCGSNMDEGHQCEVCGYVAPPDGLDNPDLGMAETVNKPQDSPAMDSPKDQEQLGTTPVGNPNQGAPNNMPQFASVNNEMSWQLHHRLAGKINPVERPIRPDGKPGTNEPNETVISDQDRPVTQRTAASMIAEANNRRNMGNARTAADAPTADTRSDKRVDVTDVGGVISPSNEEASKPEGPHSWENKGTTTDVTGKGGIIEDSNEEASRPSQGQQSLPTAERGSDDSGFNKDKTTEDSGKTKTFDNSNEPNSAVTNQAFPTSSWNIVAGDDRAFPTDDKGGDGGLGGGSAKKGTDPADPVGKADDRVDVLDHVTSPENNSGPTKTWSGTDGNGVTKQHDPVTNETLEGDDIINLKKSFVEILKIADTEIELGIIPAEQKYDRIAELGEATPEAIQATAKVLARVRTAGLKKNAATKQGGVGRVPSLQAPPRTASTGEADESLFW